MTRIALPLLATAAVTLAVAVPAGAHTLSFRKAMSATAEIALVSKQKFEADRAGGIGCHRLSKHALRCRFTLFTGSTACRYRIRMFIVKGSSDLQAAKLKKLGCD